MLDIIGVSADPYSTHGQSLGSRVENLKQSPIFDGNVGERTNRRTKLVDGTIIIETYTEDGKLVKITPPGYLPFDKFG